MRFADIFAQLATDPTLAKQGLGDGRLNCSYQVLPEIFTQLDDFFAAQDFSADTCFALQFDNSLPGALVLLYLLARERHLFVAPKPQKQDAVSLTPQFCRCILSLKSEADLTDLAQLPSALQLDPHPDYNDERDLPATDEGRLYLKTSGSMGVSKVVVHDFSALLGNAQQCVTRFRLSAADRVLIPVPIFHMYGLGAGLLPALLAGATIELLDKTNILKYIQVEKRFAPTAAFLTPTLCNMLLQGKRSDRPYRLVVSAGDKMRPAMFKTFAARFGGLVNLYGSTELGALITSDLADSADIRARYAGQPMPEVHVKLAPLADDLQEAEGVGELQLSYAYSFTHYLHSTGKTRLQREVTDWFATGDLARQHQGGYVELLGRAGLSVNRRGYLVLFSDIEQRLESLKAVDKAVLVATDEETANGKRLVAFCLVPDNTAQAENIRQACFALLPNYAIPEEIRIINEFPLLPSGKIDRQALLEAVAKTTR